MRLSRQGYAGRTDRIRELSRRHAPCGSSNDREQPAPAQRRRPAPHLPGMPAVADREEDDFGLADQVLERHIADPAAGGRDPAVERIVTVIAHHEKMP